MCAGTVMKRVEEDLSCGCQAGHMHNPAEHPGSLSLPNSSVSPSDALLFVFIYLPCVIPPGNVMPS